jgi:diguanylate cyclase (GGDEF)-like protein
MDKGVVFQLTAPIVCLGFAAAFLIISFYSRKKTSVILFALCYFSGGMGFIVSILSPWSELANPLVVNGLYLLTIVFQTLGIAVHFGKAIPFRFLAIISVITYAGMCWFTLGDYNMAARITVVNFGCGLLLLPALAMVPRKNCAGIYKAIFWILLVSFFQFYVRTVLSLYTVSDPVNVENFRDSVYVVALHFSIATVSLALGLTLCIAIAMEEIADLQQLTVTDSLSGLVNRRGFEEAVKQQIELFYSRKVPISLIVCDIDHFKKVNDRFGHEAGDRIIKGFGKIIKDSCRNTDLVARIGGEEFCILLPVATKEMAVLVANSAREAFSSKQFRNIPEETRFTASFGVAQIQGGETYEDLFKRADAALYEAKQTGRNRTVLSADQEKSSSKQIGLAARKSRAESV